MAAQMSLILTHPVPISVAGIRVCRSHTPAIVLTNNDSQHNRHGRPWSTAQMCPASITLGPAILLKVAGANGMLLMDSSSLQQSAVRKWVIWLELDCMLRPCSCLTSLCPLRSVAVQATTLLRRSMERVRGLVLRSAGTLQHPSVP